MVRTLVASWLGSLLVWHPPLVSGQTPAPVPTSDAAASGLGMSPAVACLKVEGFDQYTVLPDATLTNADKLKVYFRPLRYKVETDPTNKAPFRAKFVEDGRVRRKGEKTPVAKEDKLLEYETRYAQPDWKIYLVNTIGLESLTPGDYELDITLHDMIDGTATATQTLAFRIIPTPTPPATAAETTPKPVLESEAKKPARTTKGRAGQSKKKPS